MERRNPKISDLTCSCANLNGILQRKRDEIRNEGENDEEKLLGFTQKPHLSNLSN